MNHDPADAPLADDDALATGNERRHAWRGVTVIASDSSCAAVRRLGGRCFLAAEAPALPVMECDLPDDCDCTYRHLTDRRMRQRRVGVAAEGHAGERRGIRGRRATD